MKWYCCLWILISFCGGVHGQVNERVEGVEPTTVTVDSIMNQEPDGPREHTLVPASEVRERNVVDAAQPQRKFDEDKWKAIVGDEDFLEKRTTPKAPGFSAPWAGPVLKVLSYLAIGALIVWLLYQVFTQVSSAQRIRRTPITTGEAHNVVENIEDLDVEGLLEQARKAGNFRLAVRMYFLGLLKHLHAMNAIAWKKDKTNREYLAELFIHDFFYDDIRKLTASYEALWYGDHTIGAESFSRLAGDFETVYRKMNQTRVS